MFDAASGRALWANAVPADALGGAIGDGALVVRTCGTPQEVVATDPRTGDERWRTPLACSEEGGPAQLSVAAGVAAVQGAGEVVGLDLANGATRWRLPVGDAGGLAGSILTGSAETVVVAWLDRLAGVDRATGRERWVVPLPGFPTAPVIAGPVVLTVADAGAVVALDLATGQERWRRAASEGAVGAPPMSAGDLALVVEVSDLAPAAPTAASGRTPVELPAPSATLLALDAATGAERWRQERPGLLPSLGSSPVVSSMDEPSGTIVLGWTPLLPTPSSPGQLEGLGGDGAVRWSGPPRSVLGVGDGVVVTAPGPGGTEPNPTRVTILDASNGTERWSVERPGPVGAVLVGAGVVVVVMTPAGEPAPDPAPAGTSRLGALATVDGAVRWEAGLEGLVWPQPPAVSVSTAVAMVCGADGQRAVAFDLATGSQRWTRDGPSCDGPTTGAIAAGEAVIVATGSDVAGLDFVTGAERWAVALGQPVAYLAGGTDGLVATTDRNIVGLDPGTGRERWRLDTRGAGPGVPAVGSGVFVLHEIVPLGATLRDSIVVHDLASGALRWRKDVPGSLALPPIVLDGVVVVGRTAGPAVDPTQPPGPLAGVVVVGLDSATGEERWTIRDRGAPMGPLVADPASGTLVTTWTPVSAVEQGPRIEAFGADGATRWMAEGLVAVAAGSGLVLAAAVDGSTAVALDAATGKERWRALGGASTFVVTDLVVLTVSSFSGSGD